MCPAGRDDVTGSELYWPETPANTTASQACPPGATGNVTRGCLQTDDVVMWQDPDVTHCLNDDFLNLYLIVRFIYIIN